MAKKLIGQNLIMVEDAASDCRSASAMLRGKGDGRERAWLNFEKANPDIIDKELLMAQFSHQAIYGGVKVKHLPPRKSKLVMGLVALAIIVF